MANTSLPRRLKAAAMLLLCVAITATLLFSRLVGYVAADTRHYIPLTQSGGITLVRTGTLDENGVFHANESLYVPGRMPLLAATPDKTVQFQFQNGKTSWEGMTGIELFKTNYDGTVVSANGDDVIAPGTSNSYTLALENTANGNVTFDMEVEAYLTTNIQMHSNIPLEAKFYGGSSNKYFVGSETTWGEMDALNGVKDSGTLKSGHIIPYIIQWQWPFEGDDTYDTMLGSLSVESEVTLTIVIKTHSTFTPTATATSGIPKTGDTSRIGLWFTVMLGSSAGLMFLLLLMRREGDNKHEAT